MSEKVYVNICDKRKCPGPVYAVKKGDTLYQMCIRDSRKSQQKEEEVLLTPSSHESLCLMDFRCYYHRNGIKENRPLRLKQVLLLWNRHQYQDSICPVSYTHLMFVIFLKTKTTFTTVTGNELTVVVKLINSKNTVVVTSLAAAHGSSVFKMDDLINSCLLYTSKRYSGS